MPPAALLNVVLVIRLHLYISKAFVMPYRDHVLSIKQNCVTKDSCYWLPNIGNGYFQKLIPRHHLRKKFQEVAKSLRITFFFYNRNINPGCAMVCWERKVTWELCMGASNKSYMTRTMTAGHPRFLNSKTLYSRIVEKLLSTRSLARFSIKWKPQILWELSGRNECSVLV